MLWTHNRKIGLRHTLIWVGVIIFSIIFTLVYYYFSHNIKSNYLTFLWVPGLCILLLHIILSIILDLDLGEYGRLCLNAGSGTLMVYFVLRGIYEIALILPENSLDVRLTIILLISSIIMYALGVIIVIVNIIKQIKKK